MRIPRRQVQSWMTALADGDRSAFDPLYEALWPGLRGLARRLLADAGDAEDAAQQALLKVFGRATEFDPQRDALAWIFGITAYECRTLNRRRQRRREETLDEGRAARRRDPSSAVDRRLETEELLDEARALLGSLSPLDEETVRSALGERPRPAVPAATFRKRLERALRRLRLAWTTKHGEG